MVKELLDLAPNGYNISDLGIDTRIVFTCKFCSKNFIGDTDELQFYNYNINYGCGCIHEKIVDAINLLELDNIKSITLTFKEQSKVEKNRNTVINQLYYNYYDLVVTDVDDLKHYVLMTVWYDEFTKFCNRNKKWRWDKH